ncbi:LuxR C-terminal-related transcriptional regulator [Sinorhizobium sp. 22678]|uniref:LuxR C-terminal-related transcriptional regulator n=1 Tax=Sinorhizobium sp. 22678 TaxID=3453955 RepID=UPI003F8758C5
MFVMKERILSPLEKTCLRWIARGRTIAEIASLEGKALVEIEQHLENACASLGAASIEQALERANLSESD